MRYKENEAEKEESQCGQDSFAAGCDHSIHRPHLQKAGQTSSEPALGWGGEGRKNSSQAPLGRRLAPASPGCAFQSTGTSWVLQWYQHRSPGGR